MIVLLVEAVRRMRDHAVVCCSFIASGRDDSIMSRTIAVLIVFASFGLTHLPAQASDCDLFKAVYAPLDPQDDMSAEAGKQRRYSAQHIKMRLRFNQAQFAFRLKEDEQKASFDFGFAFANGYGGTSLVFAGPTGRTSKHQMKEDDPSSSIMYFDDNLKQSMPDWEKGGKAPRYLIMPGIGSSFWYSGLGRDFVPPAGMWKVTHCTP
jgi:hypothetical protein